jgi:hypothetical protein
METRGKVSYNVQREIRKKEGQEVNFLAVATQILGQTDVQRKATIKYVSFSSFFVLFLFSHAIQ